MLHFYQVPALEHSVKIQKCTSSGSLCAKLECANSSHSIADEAWR
ncbi:hypothetical protein RchiOBHm_Chr3g0478481 [Rosa chinensis]|uniref:Uncharacterized protein n=1 Tax=Rosa chinensis TaxID=74649 RepID=A0A2P6RD64_ROSCH|nr:hypothetical protein RchiOBHm_Chr3g0478481 [Rosa chinensis]